MRLLMLLHMGHPCRSSSIACQQPHVEHVEEAPPPPYQPLTLVDDGAGRGRSSTSCPKQVPALDLSKLKPGGQGRGHRGRAVPGRDSRHVTPYSTLYTHRTAAVLQPL